MSNWAIAAAAGALLLVGSGPAPVAAAPAPARPTVRELTLDGAVDPFVDRYIQRGIAEAGRSGDTAVLIRIDTPGGLDSSMRGIVKAILASSVPVVCWTGPSGARAASAGTFIMMACPVNAMAPGTNIGAAHPVGVAGQIEQEKVTNDAVAFIRSLAQRWHRNAGWAERAVRQAASLPAEEAAGQHVTDRLADSVPQLLGQLDGQRVPLGAGGTVVLRTAAADVQAQPLGLAAGLLHTLIDPNLAFIFFYLGLVLLVVEVLHPGVSIPGLLGTLLLVTSVVAFGILPVQLGGIVLLVASAVLYLVELKQPGIGLPAIGGTACLILGGLLLFDPSVPAVRVSPVTLTVLPALMLGFFLLVVRSALQARRAAPVPVTGGDTAIGREGVAVTALRPRGEVQAGHERWSAESVAGPIEPGTPVRVVGRRGLTLRVEPMTTRRKGP